LVDLFRFSLDVVIFGVVSEYPEEVGVLITVRWWLVGVLAESVSDAA